MDLNAFNKLYSEAIEAISEKRFSDALELTEALSKDLHDVDFSSIIADINEDYRSFIDTYISMGASKEYSALIIQLYANLIKLLQTVRACWQREHQVTSYGRIAAKMADLGWKDFLDQILRTRRSKLGNFAYHEALDAAFGIAWYCSLNFDFPEDDIQKIGRADYFVRQTLVGGLMMGVIDCFSTEKIFLLIALADLAEKDINNAELLENDPSLKILKEQACDLQARVAVALTIIYQKYQIFFPYFPILQDKYQKFFSSSIIQLELPQLLRSFVSQSLTNHVGQRMENILKVVKEIVEKQQPHLGSINTEIGSSNDIDTNPEKNDSPNNEKQNKNKVDFRMEIMRIDVNQGDKFFRKMADYAQTMDVLRMNDMDINFSNSTHLKHFEFFHHPAHWFYPFSTLIPDIQKGIILPDGSLDNMTLNIMDHSRFCDSDRYSYACMMSYLRREGKNTITDQLRDQFEEMKDEEGDIFESNSDSNSLLLNPYTNFCQTCYRFFHNKTYNDEYVDLITNNDDNLLPLLTPFNAYFKDYADLEKSIETYLFMGDGEHAVILLNYFMEHQGSTATALQQRGRAFMQLKQWRNAISDFQQSMLIEEDPDTRIYIIRCYEAMNEWDRAVPLLLEEEKALEHQDPDLIEEIARCLLQMKRWDDAVQRFFQLELMGQHLNVCRRGIGWCSLHQGKFERAEQYYGLLIETSKKPSWEDLINMGHARLLLDKRAEALEAYRQSAITFNRAKKIQRQHFRHWTEAFQEDARELLYNQFSQLELAIIQDAVMMK